MNMFNRFNRYMFIAMLALLTLACSTSVPGISPEQAAEMLAKKQIVMIDVREQNERNVQLIEGTLFIPLGQLESRISELAQYKDTKIVMQCKSGRRSNIAANTLMKAGFSKVYNLEGGILAWDEAHLPLVSGL